MYEIIYIHIAFMCCSSVDHLHRLKRGEAGEAFPASPISASAGFLNPHKPSPISLCQLIYLIEHILQASIPFPISLRTVPLGSPISHLVFDSILVPRQPRPTSHWTNFVGQALQLWRNITLLFLLATTAAQRYPNSRSFPTLTLNVERLTFLDRSLLRQSRYESGIWGLN